MGYIELLDKVLICSSVTSLDLKWQVIVIKTLQIAYD